MKKSMTGKVLILAFAAISFVVTLVFTSRINWDKNILSLLPETQREIGKYKELIKEFRIMDAMFLDISRTGSLETSENDLVSVGDSFAEILENSGYFKKILYKWDYSSLLYGLEILKKHRAALFTENDEKRFESITKTEAIIKTLDSWKRRLIESPAPFMTKSLYEDPLGFNEVFAEKFYSFQELGGPITISSGRMFSKDKKHVLMILYPRSNIIDSRASKELTEFMDENIKKFSSGKNLRIAYLSGHRFTYENEKRIKRDVFLTLIVSIAAIIFLTFLVYSRPGLALLVLLPAVYGLFVSLGILKWLLPDVSIIIIGCGALLIGITVDYGIHFLFNVDQYSWKNGIKMKGFSSLISARIRKPVILSAATTIAAFLSLQFSDLPGYKHLGVFVSLGIAASAFFVLVVLPLLVPSFKKEPHPPAINLSGGLASFFRISLKYRKILLLIVFLVSIVVIPGYRNIGFEGDISKLNAASEDIKKDMEIVNKSFGDSTSSTLVIAKGENLEEALRLNEDIFLKLKALKEEGVIERFTYINYLLPSKRKQRENIKRWNSFHRRIGEKFRKNFYYACSKLRMRKEVFADFINSLPGSNALLDCSDYNGSAVEDIISNQIVQRKDMVLTTVKLVSDDKFPILKKKLSNPGIIIYNGKDFITTIVHLITGQMRKIGIISLLFIVVILSLYRRNLKTVLFMIMPLFLSLFWTFGIMGWLNIKINIINCFVMVFTFGLVVDYCIFLVAACEKNTKDLSSVSHSAGAIVVSALTTMFGLGALVLASHPALFSLGVTALLAISSGLLAVFILVPLFFLKER